MTFKCIHAEGDPAADLVVDIENEILLWGLAYRIHSITDQYISAHRVTRSEVGGDIFVFDRISGNYLFAAVGIYFHGVEDIKQGKPGYFTTNTFSGKCTRPLL